MDFTMFAPMRWITLFGAILTCAAPCNAATLAFNLDFVFGAETPAATSELKLILEDFGNNQIKVTLDNNMVGDLNAFVDEFYFSFQGTSVTGSGQNKVTVLDPLFAGLSFDTGTASPSASLTSVDIGADEFQADGDGKYDFIVLLENEASSGDRISPGESFSIILKHSDANVVLSVDMFDVLSTQGGGNGPFYAAAHVNSVGSGDSTWLGDDDGGDLDEGTLPAPEPTSLAAWLLGSAGLGLILRGRMKKAAA